MAEKWIDIIPTAHEMLAKFEKEPGCFAVACKWPDRIDRGYYAGGKARMPPNGVYNLIGWVSTSMMLQRLAWL